MKQSDEVKIKRTPSRGSWLSLETNLRGEEIFILNFSDQTQGKHHLRNKAACESNALFKWKIRKRFKSSSVCLRNSLKLNIMKRAPVKGVCSV